MFGRLYLLDTLLILMNEGLRVMSFTTQLALFSNSIQLQTALNQVTFRHKDRVKTNTWGLCEGQGFL